MFNQRSKQTRDTQHPKILGSINKCDVMNHQTTKKFLFNFYLIIHITLCTLHYITGRHSTNVYTTLQDITV